MTLNSSDVMACRFNFSRVFCIRFITILLTCCIAVSGNCFAFDHHEWDELLKAHTEDGLVNYVSFQDDEDKLDRYLKTLADYPLASLAEESREERIALWINVFNALMIREILRHYPVDSANSITDLWSRKRMAVSGLQYTLKEIRDEILRGSFREERALLALATAEMSSPPLRNEAYAGNRLTEQLADQMNMFITNDRYNQIHDHQKKLRLSPVFREFADDFVLGYGQSQGTGKFSTSQFAVLNFIKVYVQDPKIKDWIVQSKYKVSYLKGDKRLNDTKFLEKKTDEN